MKVLLLLSILITSHNIFAGTEVMMNTSMGVIEIELYDKKSSETVRNFLQYVDEGFYSNVIFHRVIKDYIIQGGGLDVDFKEKKTHPEIQNEALKMVKNLKGTIAMARRGHRHSATSQFYFNLRDNPNLNHSGFSNYGYAVFGKITKGLDIAIKIGNVSITEKGLYKSVPTTAIIIKAVTRK